MILPLPELPDSFGKRFWTLFLVGLNIVCYFAFNSSDDKSFDSQKVLQRKTLTVAGRLYRQHQLRTPSSSALSPDWLTESSVTENDAMAQTGLMAIKDLNFLNQAPKERFLGDQIEINDWKNELQNFKEIYLNQDSFYFGLSNAQTKSALSGFTWLTYQFSHSNLSHLVSNMVFLLLIGNMLEAYIAGELFLMVYVLSGLVGGWFFLMMQSSMITPMVGASASISGLLSFAWLTYPKKNLRYFYFISPLQGHTGFIFLPTVLLVPVFILGDFTSLISQLEGFAMGVAYAAHVGGALAGLFLGLIYISTQKWVKNIPTSWS